MKGSTIEYQPARGKKTFGYTFFAGRDESGKRIQVVKRGFETRTKAEDALREAIAAHQKTSARAHGSRTLHELFEEWMKRHVERNCTPRTAEAYQEQGRYVLRTLGALALGQLTRNGVEDAMHAIADHGGVATAEHPRGRPLAHKTVRGIGFVLHGCLDYAVYRDYLPKNPMDGMKLPKLEKNRKPKIVEADEFEKLLRLAADTRLFPLIVTAEATGCRRGELCALTWSDIDWATGVMTVDKSLEETKAHGLRLKGTKGEKPRPIVIPAYALEVLKSWRAEQARDRELYGAQYAAHDLVFCRPDGEYYVPKQVTARVREAMRKAGLRRSLHCLRHSHASGMLSKGVPVAAVAARLGHANANVTLSIYTHALRSDHDVAAAVWEQERGGMLANVIKKPGLKLVTIGKKRA
jgi:ATP-dependent helicase/nuclease subunit A